MADKKVATQSVSSDKSGETLTPGEVQPKPNPETLPPPVVPTSGEQTTSGNLDGLNMRSPRFWLAAGAVLLILVAVLVTISYLAGNKQKQQKAETGTLIISSPIPGASPYKLPAVSAQSDIDLLKDYFKQASPNFGDELMSLVPAVAVDYYKKYKDAAGDAKLEAARAFYIYLNNPASVANEQYKTFIEDVKVDLEKSLGQPLF